MCSSDLGGELYIPKIPSMKILDLAEAIARTTNIQEIGIRPGEKLHEEMISPDDSRRTIELEKRYVVMPLFAEWGFETPKGKVVADGFSYRSDTNKHWLSVNEIRVLLGME